MFSSKFGRSDCARPSLSLLLPSNNTSYRLVHTVFLEGTGVDDEGRELQESFLSWSSNQNGFLGRGNIFCYSDFSLGDHIITLEGTDSSGISSTISINISITENDIYSNADLSGAWYDYSELVVVFDSEGNISKSAAQSANGKFVSGSYTIQEDGQFYVLFNFPGGDYWTCEGQMPYENRSQFTAHVRSYFPDGTLDTDMGEIIVYDKCQVETYDIITNGIPEFVSYDFTDLAKIERISKFRSGAGHDYSDMFEDMRSMKLYYSAYSSFRINNKIEVHSPINGEIFSITDESHGYSGGLINR